MAPVVRSAFEVYQQALKKKVKKTEKRQKKKRLQQEAIVANLNGSLHSSENGTVQRVTPKPTTAESKDLMKRKTKALKRLSVGGMKPLEKHPKKTKGTPGTTTDDSFRSTSVDSSFEGPFEQNKEGSKKLKDSPAKKVKKEFAKEESGKNSKEDSGKKSKEDSGKKSKVDSGKESKEDSGKKSKEDSGKKSKVDKKSKEDSGKKSKEDSGKKSKADSGKKSEGSANAGYLKISSKGVKRPVDLLNDSSLSDDRSPPKRKETKKQRRVENEVGKAPKFLDDENISVDNSTESGREVLQWLITPIQIQPFLEKYWEQRPLYISRAFHRNFLQDILSSEDIDIALRENSLQFTRNIDVTSYVNGVRETHNPVGRAHAFTVWDYYRNGCSVRILNPQTYFKKLRKICTSLQECFNCFVGANVYLTPPNSQGFAPHYDDIEAFVLQLEGKKKWKIYQPRKGEKLPRTSSGNFSQDEMKQPLLEIELQPGDVLYMPRGFIHQASTVPNSHSLHVTISAYQHSSWADVMEKVVPAALASAIESDAEFREGIPWDFLHHTGVAFSTDETRKRREIADKIKRLFCKMIDHLPFDAAADQIAKEFLHEALPPMLQSSEVEMTVHGDGARMKNGDAGHLKQLTLDSSVKLVRRNVLRLVSEGDGDTVKIYHCAENPLVCMDEELKCCELNVESAPAVEALVRNYPEYTQVGSLPIEDDEKKLQIAMALWERGILLSADPLPDFSFSED